MASTSPRHMSVLGNVQPIKIKTMIFIVTSFLCSLAKCLKEIVGPVFKIYAIGLLGSMSTGEA